MIDFLFRNPILLLLLVSWLVSGLGKWLQRTAKRAAERQRQQSETAGASGAEVIEDRDTWPDREVDPVEERDKPGRKPAAGRRPAGGRDPEEIAREIRRAMGLEPAESTATPPVLRRGASLPRPSVAAPSAERGAGRASAPAPVKVEIVPDVPRTPRKRSTLIEELAAKAEAQVARQTARDKHFDDVLEVHNIEGSPAALSARARRRAQSVLAGRLIDLHRPASAILAAEILGPPVAYRRDHLERNFGR